MALTLAQAAVAYQSPLARQVVRKIRDGSQILDRIPVMPIEGNSYAYVTDGSLPGVAFRGVNEGYVESTGTYNQASEKLSIMGGDSDIDEFIIRTMGQIVDHEAEAISAKTRALIQSYNSEFFNGDITVNPKGFDGLKKRIVNNQVVDFGTNGGYILGSPTASNDERLANFYDFLDVLQDGLSRVQGINSQNGAIYMEAADQARFVSGLRRIGGYDGIIVDIAGKRVLAFNGIPVLDPGQGLVANGDGTFSEPNVLQHNETQGTSSGTSSIYIVKFGGSPVDQGVTCIANGPLRVRRLGELQDKPARRTRIEWYPGLAVFGGKAAVRIRGIRG